MSRFLIKKISMLLGLFTLSNCATQRAYNDSKVADENSNPEGFSPALYFAGAYSSTFGTSNLVFGMSEEFKTSGKEIATGAFLIGTILSVDQVRRHQTYSSDRKDDQFINLNLMSFSAAGLTPVVVHSSGKPPTYLGVLLAALSWVELPNASYNEANQLPPKLATTKFFSFLGEGTAKGFEALSTSSKKLWEANIAKSDIRESLLALENKFANNAQKYVSAKGTIQDEELTLMAVFSEVKQKGKPIVAKDFARQIQLAFTLPYEAPKTILSQNKVTDPIAINIFENRSKLRKIGLM